MLILLPLLGVLFNGLTTAHVEANLSLEFKATKLLRQHNPANCTVGNTTYAHGQTFKLDCKTQCVCENGRHACSSLCPKEQLPAPEDTISCRSPRLVEVPGHCCKMWLCENPTADVYATCHNASTSPWTPCSQPCGLGISTRFTSTNAGCRQLSSLRLCENRKCDHDNKNNSNNSQYNRNYLLQPQEAQPVAENAISLQQLQQHQQQLQKQKQQLISHNVANNLVVSEPKDIKDITNYPALFHAKEHEEHEEHRIRKGHECRSLQRLGPARIRLGACISRKLYRPKLCGRCHQQSGKCCKPSLSTTIQVELLCPLNADDPITYAEQQTQQQQPQQQPEGPAPATHQLWDTVSLEPIDQEFLQSHQIQIENKFIAVEWILKCECSKHENCNNQHGYATKATTTTTTMDNNTKQSNNGSDVSHNSGQQQNTDIISTSNNNSHNNNNINDSISNGKSTVSSWRTSAITVVDHKNNKNAATNIIGATTRSNNGDNAYDNNSNNKYSNNNNSNNNSYATNNLNTSGYGNNKQNLANSNHGNNNNNKSNEQGIAAYNGNDNRQEQRQLKVEDGAEDEDENENESDNESTRQQQLEEEQQQQEHLLSSSELQPDIIPYPAMLPPHRSSGSMEKQWTQLRKTEKSEQHNNHNNNLSNMYALDSKPVYTNTNTNNINYNNKENDRNNNNIAMDLGSAATTNSNIVAAGFGFYARDVDEGVDDAAVGHNQRVESVKQNESSEQQQQQLLQNTLAAMEQHDEDQEEAWQAEQKQLQQQRTQLPEWQAAKNLHYASYHQQQHQHHHHQHHQHHHHHHLLEQFNQQEQRQQHNHHHHPLHQHHTQHHQTHPNPQLQQLLWSDQLDQVQQTTELHTPHQRRT